MKHKIPLPLHFLFAALILIVGIALLSACDTGKQSQSRRTEKAARDVNLDQQDLVTQSVAKILANQQIAVHDFSQIFETVNDVETIQAEGTHGTAQGYEQGVGMIWWCPTVGMPVPGSFQVTPSTQYVDIRGDGTEQKFPVELPEPHGVYLGETTNTNTICLDDAGNEFLQSWEGHVNWTSGIVEGLPDDLRARVDEVTYDFTIGKDEAAERNEDG